MSKVVAHRDISCVYTPVPIRFSANMRKAMLKSVKIKNPMGYLSLLAGLKLRDLAPELPGVTEFSTNETMGHSADRLVHARFLLVGVIQTSG